MDGAGAWCGGSMTLTEGASTMGREGGHAHHAPADRRPLGRGPDARSSTSCCSRTRSSRCTPTTRCSTRCGRAPVDRTDVVCEWFFEPATIAAEGFDPSDAIEFWDQVNREDWHVCELTTKGVRTRGYVAGRYSAEEVDVHAFDVMVADRYMEVPRARRGAEDEVAGR